MRRVLREPMLHFLLLGVAIFVAFQLAGGGDDRGRETIVVTEGQVESLATAFARTWQRPPTAEELEGLVADWVREEVYYREAVALGLDRDDTVVRRRLRQKLEFLAEDLGAAAPEASEAALRAHLAAHPERFARPGRVSFVQVPLDPERRGDALGSDAEALLAALRRLGAEADAASLGDPSLLEPELRDATPEDVERRFGPAFAERLDALPVGRWSGPVASTYGVHLVLVRERTPPRTPELDAVREAVQRDWAAVQRTQAREAFYESLRERYDVTVERPSPQALGSTRPAGDALEAS